ncbi:sensor histidine kinase [Actinorhabdospora filicis]|uniref:sensor histidine kinase n=1 Tax=Actinorhabdospora filicis TaxID=1785913 RepID=UPI0025533E48|nr:HAMP domain-containing sensor histidine kinase [Actinorhabdospora filicis]
MRGLWPQSVRWRTTLFATAVSAFALVAVGALVLLLLRANLAGTAQDRAELAAREIATALADGTPPQRALPHDDELVVLIDGPATDFGEDEDPVPRFGGEPRPAPPPGDDDHGGRDDGHDYDDSYTKKVGRVLTEVRFDTVKIDGKPHRFAAITAQAPDGTCFVVYAGVSTAVGEEAVGKAARYMLLALAPVLLVIAGVTWLVTRRALRPVAAIRAELAAITAGDLSRRVPEPGSRDEIGDLARTTNATLAQLDAAVSQQRRFIADASHELRSPIATIRARLEVGAEHPGLLRPAELLDDVVRLQRLATDLLLLARLDAGERPPSRAVDLAGLLREAAARPAPYPVRLEVPEELTVPGVRSRLERVLTNLLDNAQHHTSTAVWVTARVSGGHAVIEVADDGPGVPVAERERVFGRFVRLDEARSRDEGGAGLGLAIVADLVAAHGGTVEVADRPGGGALLRVTLPASRDF